MVTNDRITIDPMICLELLKGDRKGDYSIRINKQWRICFAWFGGHALDVEITDYH
jgi:toxin HigB-1